MTARRHRPGARADGDGDGPFEAVHANYWLSGLAGHAIKHELDLPLVSTFHTLDRVKAEAGPEEVEADMPHRRAEAEAAIIRCSDAVLASCSVEADQIAELYHADPARIAVVAPGRRPRLLRPGAPPAGPPGARAPGRRDPAAVRRAASSRSRVPTWRCGPWPSSGTGPRAAAPTAWWSWGARAAPTATRPTGACMALRRRTSAWPDRVTLVTPQPHELLSTYYRAADACLVPSRSESFGLVALEAAACGTPVVASAVGGLTTLVDDGRTGFLVDDADPGAFAAAVRAGGGRAAAGRAPVHGGRAAGPALHLAGGGGRASAPSTTSWWPGRLVECT